MPFAFNNKYFVRAVGAVQNYAKLLDTSTAGTYSITLDKESVIKVVLVGGGGAAAMKGVYDDRGYGWTGGSGGAFEGSFTVPAGTYEVVVGSANNNNKAQGGNTNTMNPDDTSKHDSYITGVVRVGGGGSGTTSGVGAAGASATFDITPIKTVINTSGKAGASGSGGKGSGANWTHNGAESVYGGYGKGQGCSTSEYANRRYWIAGTGGYARVEVISKKEFDKAVKYYDTVCPEYKTLAINPDPADAVVTIGEEVTNSKRFKKWTTVEYKVEKDGYRSETGSVKLKDNVTIDISLLKFCTFTINPDPADAIITIDGEVRNSITVLEGSIVSYTIEADGKKDVEGSITVVEDTVLDIVMEEAVLDPALKGVPVQFNYTGAVQTYMVPLGCKKVSVDCIGAGGGGYANVSGKGGRVQCTMSVKGNKPLYIYVGGQGSSSAGWNGGGQRAYTKIEYNNSGAGASDIRTVQASSGSWYDTSHTSWDEDVSLLSRLVVAGGGGGMCQNGAGGDGGGLEGGVRNDSSGTPPTPATQTSGGTGAISGNNWHGGNGVFGRGGDGRIDLNSNQVTGAGGGGGWYGGGGGVYFQSGGGGSSYTHPDLCTDVIHTQGYRDGHGYVIITPIE